MKAKVIPFLLIFIITTACEAAAKTPPPVTAQCRITCRVELRAEWQTERPQTNDLTESQIQAGNTNQFLIINAAPSTAGENQKSSFEINSNEKPYKNNLPVETITTLKLADPTKPAVKIVTACWKM
jgi:hypothetical protein